ncbi:hypothetical protein JW935_04260 [candidate division KSB1 bacterium]|nr:hypothetical protein [candidate division KSB1 bacterium]
MFNNTGRAKMNTKLVLKIFMILSAVLFQNCNQKTPVVPDNSNIPDNADQSDNPPTLFINTCCFEFTKDQLENTLEISNVGDSTLNWNISKLPSWLTVFDSIGVTTDKVDTVFFKVNSFNFSGDRIDQFSIQSNGGEKEIIAGFFFARQISNLIIDKSNQFFISRVGQEFFDHNISLDLEHSQYCFPSLYCYLHTSSCPDVQKEPRFLIVYSFKIKDRPFVNESISFETDTTGFILTPENGLGIPDCISQPIECQFPIDEDRAILIAKEAGLEDGIKEWKTSFHWFAGDLQTFVWTVSNTLSESGSGEGYTASGKVVVIDANTGEICRIDSWTIMA